MMKNNARLFALSGLVFALTACSNSEAKKYPSEKERKQFLSTYSLSDENACYDYKKVREDIDIQEIGFYSSPDSLPENQIITSSEELRSFLNNVPLRDDDDYAANESIYNFCSTLDDKNFDEYNLLISKTLVCNYRAFNHEFSGLYLKDNTLFVYLLYHDYLPPDVLVACVAGYEYLTLYIGKNVHFENIEILIHNETSYRKR